METPIKKEFIRVGDAKVACIIKGSGEPAVFLHGIPDSSYQWHKVIHKLQSNYMCIAPDLMGLGDTEAPLTGDFSMPAQTDMIVNLMEALKIKSPHLVAHDQGGAIAQIIAAKHPEKIKSLAMMDVVTRDNWPVPSVKALAVLARSKRLFDLALVRLPSLTKLSASMTWAMPKAFYDRANYTEDIIAELFRPISASKERRDRFRKFVVSGDPKHTIEVWDKLGEFDRPTLILWASHDVFLHIRWGKLLAAHIKGADNLKIIHQTGHYLALEKPSEVAAELSAFWEKSITGQ